MKLLRAGVIALLMVMFAGLYSGPAIAYKDVTRSQALAQCEGYQAWERNNAPLGWVWHGYCKEAPSDYEPFPDNPMYLGCFQAWGNNDIPAYNNFNPDTEGSVFCYGRLDDVAGANAGPGGCDGGEGGCTPDPTLKSDPVNTATGNKYVEESDYSDDAWLRFRRFYNSDPETASNTMGMRWSHSFSRKLDPVGLQNGVPAVFVYRPTGRRELFKKSENTGWVATADVADKLSEIDDAQGNVTGYQLWIAALRHTETYTEDGLLSAVQDQTGQTTTLSYSDASTPRAIAPRAGLLLNVVSPNGRQLSFLYNAAGYVQQATLPDGGHLSFDYDRWGNLVAVTYPDGKKRTYVYNEPALTGGNNLTYAMTGLIDENGVRFDSTSYDASGRAISTEQAGGVGRLAIQYNTDGTSDLTFPLGGISHQAHATVQQHMLLAGVDTPCGECDEIYASRTYDANSRPATYTDFNGNIRKVVYDSNGLLTQSVDAAGTADERTTDTTWNSTLRVALSRTVKDSHGTIVSKQGWAYNASGQVTAACTIDAVAAPSYVCSASGSAPSGVRRTVNAYCTAVDGTTCLLAGLLLSVDGPRSDVQDITRYSYYLTTDESGCDTVGGACHRLGDLKAVTDAAGLITTYVSYDKAGRVTRQRAPNGVLTDYAYTPRGWVATFTVRSLATGVPSAGDSTTSVAYNPDGTTRQVIDADGVGTIYAYDAAHRLTDMTDGAGNRLHYTLDAAGNRTKEQTFAADGSLVTSTTRSFNGLGHLTSMLDGLGRSVFSATDAASYDGNGNLVISRDGLGYQKKQVFDGLDRLVSTIRNYQGADAATKDAQSVTSFDVMNRVTGFSDPDGLNTTYDIDGLGNGQATHSPDTGDTARTFDLAGNTLSSTDAPNNTRTMAYDADNRPLAVSFTDASLDIQYKYDEADAVTGCTGNYGAGRRTRIIEANGGITWCYDGRSNVVSKRQMIGTEVRTTTYGWTLGNRLASITTPNGTLVSYARDALGRITAVTATPPGSPAVTVAHDVAYTAFGPIASLMLGDGQTVAYTYDATGALMDIASPAFTLHMKRDAMGNLTAIGDAPGVPAAAEAYTYDPLYRLAGVDDASGTAIEAYTYNKTGDRLTKAGAGVLTGSYGYAPGTHHLTTIGTTSRVIDARGNTTSSNLATGGWSYVYNQRNRMTAVQLGGVTVGAYVLNALGERVQKTAGATVTRFDYDEGGRLLSEASGVTSRDYVWLGSVPVGVVDRTDTIASVTFVHADGLGSPRAVTNAAGSVMWQWAYPGNPFGEKVPVSAGGYTVNTRFPGQYFDAESGLLHNGYRDYEPATGRYLQSDPIGLIGGASTYGYVNGSPLRRTDAAGLQSAGGPPEENVPENIPEVDEEIEELDREAREGIPPPGEATIPRPDAGEWGPNGECLRPELRPPQANMSPSLDPRAFAGRTPQEIDDLARSHGLIPKGPDPMNGRGGYVDPVTGAQRVLSHGYDDPPHMHVNDPSGQRLDIFGNVVDPNSPDAHLPIGQP
jgi:RHS repeat-associated protein